MSHKCIKLYKNITHKTQKCTLSILNQDSKKILKEEIQKKEAKITDIPEDLVILFMTNAMMKEVCKSFNKITSPLININRKNIENWKAIFKKNFGITYSINKDTILNNPNKMIITDLTIESRLIYLTNQDYYINGLWSDILDTLVNFNINGNLILSNNLLKTLPKNFGNIIVGGNLELSNNLLQILPESFGNIKVGGNLLLSYNLLKKLPESFKNITVGGNLVLSYNLPALILPYSFDNVNGHII